MNNETQIVKGILEGCLLKIISREPIYGYKAVETLVSAGFDVNEATVYPILSRLQNKGLLDVERRPSPLGPMRKYYFLTADGFCSLEEFIGTWKRIAGIVNMIMEDEKSDEQE